MTEIAKQEIIPVTPDSFSADFAKGHFLNIEHMLGSKEKADKFIAQSTYYLKMNPDIIEKCSPSSIMKALIKCAELDLYPSSASGEAYIVVRKGVACFQTGYKGEMALMYRSGVEVIYSDIRREKDSFNIVSGTDPRIFHEYAEGDRGKVLGVYSWAKVNGHVVYKYMTTDELDVFEKMSIRGWGKDIADPQLWMQRKTCIRQMGKTLPKNTVYQRAIEYDEENNEMEEYMKLKIKEDMQKDSEKNIKQLLTPQE